MSVQDEVIVDKIDKLSSLGGGVTVGDGGGQEQITFAAGGGEVFFAYFIPPCLSPK